MKRTGLFYFLVCAVQILFAQQAPVAVNDTFAINRNTTVTFPVTANDYDLDGDPLILSLPSNAAHGNATVVSGQLQYTPVFNYTGTDTVSYIICDVTNRCAGALVYITIDDRNNPPVAVNDTYTINKNTTATFPVTANDYDLDGDPLTVSIHYNAAHGNAAIVGGQVQYTPNLNYVGADTFGYFVCDTTNLCDNALVYVNILDVNTVPVAANDTFSVPENVSTFLPVAGNDYDTDGDPLTIIVVSGAQHGTTAVTNGTQVIYTPVPFYFGADSFLYIICDNKGGCDTAVVYLNVSGTNSHPTPTDDAFVFTDTVNEVTLDVLANDVDDENDSLFVLSAFAEDTTGLLGTIALDNATGEVVFTRLPLACGSETFSYIVCDAHGCDTGTITVTVNCPDKVFLPQGFSPDGDGKNDKLVFTGLEYFAPALLKVFNRYGTLVYESEEYQNDWGGTNLESNKPLPDGSYFYVLQLADKTRYNNYLIINR